ncbi:DUF1697 domain-containing protein [Sphingomonas mucosissima]|uniref:DUF1697 domain-containing protein n=1 Tax=Sphingomonas mucosissima TaxID=370959 RepID=A0A245ZH05_9SPHN|nr:DUF1697 domain-containing protein [Sphingomonas mucosissima]OWK29008.1 hypothetical protein SPMU_25340 [Sphingomonas mucosissima]
MIKHVALLRGINVGGHRRVPMQDLRSIVAEVGYRDARTYVASGNVVFASDQAAELIETTLENAIQDRFGFPVDVIARSAAQWLAYVNSNPFCAQGDREPNLVMLCVGKQPATEEHALALRHRAGANERVELRGDTLWLYFGDGSGRSKMGVGPTSGIWTTRNLRSVCNIASMLD